VKQRIIACVLIAVFASSSFAFAQQPARLSSAIRKAASQGVAQQPMRPAHEANRYFWPGLVIIGAGATLATLAATAAKKETCGVASIGFDVIGGCVDETNKLLLWLGVGAAAGGATLLAIGGTRHQVAIASGVVQYRVRF
jgi:hypothetical protein